MTEDEFRDLLDRYGGDLDGWPRMTARDARLLLARSVVAQAMLDETVAIELALADPDFGPSPDLADRIFDAAFGDDEGGGAPATDRENPRAPRRLM